MASGSVRTTVAASVQNITPSLDVTPEFRDGISIPDPIKCAGSIPVGEFARNSSVKAYCNHPDYRDCKKNRHLGVDMDNCAPTRSSEVKIDLS